VGLEKYSVMRLIGPPHRVVCRYPGVASSAEVFLMRGPTTPSATTQLFTMQ
jgi:hypothetical protein